MPETTTPRVGTAPALLLMEPDATARSERALHLSQSPYCVSVVENARDIFLMSKTVLLSVAVLSDKAGHLALRASAEIIRARWPHAKILILGSAPKQFEDQLYDDTLSHKADQTLFLSMIERLRQESWTQRAAVLGAKGLLPDRKRHGYERAANTHESDPAKAVGPFWDSISARE